MLPSTESNPVEESLPSFSYRERFLIALGVAVIIFSVLSFFADRSTIVFACFTTLGLVGLLIYQQMKVLRSSALTLAQSEERFRVLVKEMRHITDTIPGILFIIEMRELKKVYLNDEAGLILRYSPHELSEMGDEFFIKVLHPEDKGQLVGLRDKLNAQKIGHTEEIECRLRDAEGEWHWFDCRLAVFAHESDGTPTQCLGIGNDITALKRAHEATKRLEQVAMGKQRLALLGELSASVAHEIRNPMQGMLNCIEELQNCCQGDERVESTLVILEDGLRRMDHISSRLLGLARNEGEKLPSDVGRCIELTCALIRARAQKVGVTLETEVEAGLPLVPMQSERISEALLNLINNAIDACSSSNGGRVKVSVFISKSVSGMLEFRVSDTGSGIPVEAKDRIFEMFFTTKVPGKGTGLGMAIVKKIFEAHDGRIELVESSSQGTIFKALIPLKSASVDIVDLVRE